jgi:hypothetical protein
VAVGWNGGSQSIITSPDGVTWTRRSHANGETFLDVAYGNGYYVAIGTAGSTNVFGIYSTDLATWTLLPAAVNANSHYITFQNNQFIAIQNNSVNAFYTGNNPTTGWTYLSGGGIGYVTPIGSNDSIKHKIAVYDNKYWFGGGSTTYPVLLTVNSSTVTTNPPGLLKPAVSYNGPLAGTSAGGFNTFTAILINSTGGIVLGDSQGGLFTSF